MKKTIKLISALVIALSLSAFSIIKPNSGEGYKIGDIAEDFSLKNIDGNMVSLSDYKYAKGFIITFTCNTCPYSVMYEDRIIALNNTYASEGYPVIAIMPNNTKIKPGDSFDAMKQRAQEKGFTFPYLIDAQQTVYPKFGATKTPHIFILQKTDKGNMVKYIGAIDNNYKDASAVTEKYVENAIDAILNGKAFSPTETKAIGCSIKA
ncbi:thioredoxin family protein [Gelatiniphilus marinus]|uniref:Thioredoxin family protein n=1 Tax=Gelatiniphilus marinus TaxID=1759464 RepID=A0ABW5JP45_9FLAO